MLVRSTSEGGEQEQGLCGSAGVSRRFPLTLPSLSAGDLHVKQTAGCWVAKAAASKASSVSWLGLEDLSAGGQGFGHPAQPVRDVLDSATSAEDADAADAVALRAQLGPAPASRPPQSDALGVPPGSSPGLWRSDSAQAALFATHAQGARAKVESDTESAGGVLWPDGDLAIAFDETLEHGDFPRDSVLERCGGTTNGRLTSLSLCSRALAASLARPAAWLTLSFYALLTGAFQILSKARPRARGRPLCAAL